MGFRSGFLTTDMHVEWPDWFYDKHKELVHFNPERLGAISSKHECKHYGAWSNLEKDIQKVLADADKDFSVTLLYMHECRGVTKFEITKDSIRVLEPQHWSETKEITHHYCYGCSDANAKEETW